MSNEVFEGFVTDDGEVRVDLLVQPVINYALLHNRVPAVRHLAITNLTDEPLTGLEITLDLSGPDGLLTATWSKTVPGPLPPDGRISWEDFAEFIPDARLLRGTDEAFPVDYRLAVTRPGRPDLRLTAPSSVLAHDEWFHSPSLYESLAAFVQPNTGAVEAVLATATGILLERTGSGALQGYQDGSGRAAHIAGAVYEALRQLDIDYQALPASFENTGQKVRTTAVVLQSRLGNCVDLSVTYAACLEAAGLRPLIWLTQGYAFAGFLLGEERLARAAETEANLLVSMVESGRAIPVELTGIGPGPDSADFTTAVTAALRHFRSDGDSPRCVVDVHLAHRSGIRPLPSADERPSTTSGAAAGTAAGTARPAAGLTGTGLTGTGTAGPEAAEPGYGSIDLPAGMASSRLGQRAEEAGEASDQRDESPARIRRWKKSLLDLSLRNPLLNLPKQGRGLELHVPAGALPVLDDLIHSGKPVEIIAQDAISHIHRLTGARRAQDLDPAALAEELRADRRIYAGVTEQRYKNAMRAIQRESRTMVQETGGNYLYLTIGTLVHPKGADGEAHAPLFLLPVRVEGGTGNRPYVMVVDGNEIATPNYCLIEWLRVRHRVEIPELMNPARDESGIDIPKTLAAISSGLLENRLNYRVDETASLRLLQFATFQMWRDLTDHWSTFMESPVVRHLVQSTGATFADPAGGDEPPVVDEAELHLPIPADGSQMRAVVMAERGQSFVLEGPPGTGKSQTITNLIARAVAAGRTVLFVAEKQAALDVVKRRLQQVGLGPFSLDLHGRRQSINAIREQLRDALDQRERGDDGTWTAVETGYRSRLVPLASYPPAVHTSNAAGLSLWSSYQAKLAYGDGPVADIPVPYLSVPAEQQRQVEQSLRDLPAAARSARLRARHPWSISGRRSLDGMHTGAVTQLADELEQLRTELTGGTDTASAASAAGTTAGAAGLTSMTEPIVQPEQTARLGLAGRPELVVMLRELAGPADIRGLLGAVWLAVRGTLPDRTITEQATDPRWDAAVGQLAAELSRFHRTYGLELSTFRPDVLALPELAPWYNEARDVGRRLFGKGKRRRAMADRLVPYLLGGAALDPEQIEATLGRLLTAQGEASALHRQAMAVGGLRLPPGWLPADPRAEEQLAAARRATEVSRELLGQRPRVWAMLEHGLTGEHASLLDRLAAAWDAWLGVLHSGPAELMLWADGGHWYDAWQRDGACWVAEVHAGQLFPLQLWATVMRHIDVLTEACLTKFRDRLLRGELNPDQAEEAYRRGVAATSLAERLRAGNLEYFDAGLHDDRIAQFETAAGELRRALPERLPTVLVRRRPFTPGQRQGRFADFAAEIRRKRGGKSFRELFQAYPDVILALTPCVLVSPASAANFLAPRAARFDLVIFDEASQIRVAEAVGAMGRGRATVIVGDSRQMPPTTVMQASHGDDDGDGYDGSYSDGHGYGAGYNATGAEAGAEIVPEDLESILSEAVESGLPQQWLSWHYRSHNESLIAFSNRFYYDNKLSSLPSPGSTGSGVLWQRVAGTFDRGGSRTNEVEAKAVVAEVSRRLREPATAHQSLGVVTFNIQQRDLILNLLEDSGDPAIREQLSGTAAEPIFVKNLENVQGDERDVVLFSLAFSVNQESGQLPLTFGPLSQAGGERRLNVAITRARRQVMLFASFDPTDIDLTRTCAIGTQHLRAYCDMAAAGLDRLGDLAINRAERHDRVRDEVVAAIRERGHEVRTGLGLSDFTVDIAVRAPGADRWQVAVMLDGPSWSERPTVADRDLAPALLRDIMGWPQVVRFWLPAWLRDRTPLLDQIDAAITAARAATASTATASTATANARATTAVAANTPTEHVPANGGSVGVAGENADIAAVPFEPYQPTPLGAQSDLDEIATSESVQETMRTTLREIIDGEGPVEQHRLARLTLARFGFTKTRPERRAAVLALLDPDVLRHHEGAGGFAWPSGLDPQQWKDFRTNRSSADRTFDEIAPEEVRNAIMYALRRNRGADPNDGISEEELLRSTMELLGFRRKSEKIARGFQYGLDLALADGRAERRGDGSYHAV